MGADDVTFEGAATSLQIHLRTPPGRFANLFNAIQLATPVVLASACNSPTFLGHRLWDETRVALFKQAVDDRRAHDRSLGAEARVSFGLDWTVLSRSRWPDHGLFARGSNRLYVHRGTGFYGFPLRVGVPGELSLIELMSRWGDEVGS